MLRAEVWTRPGDANYGLVIAEPPIQGHSYHDAMNEVGDGSMRIPNTYSRFDEILKPDEATPANSVKSTVRIFDGATWVGDWFPESLLPTTDKFDLNVDISGPSIKDALAWARVEAYDWDGSDDWVPQFPDWVYGGPNALQNPGIENNTLDPEIYELWNDRSGGTFTIDAGGTPSGSLAENISDGALETALQALTEITDVLVTGSGTESDPWVIEFVTPGFGITLNVTDTGLVSTLSQTNEGSLVPSPWTKSQQVSFGTPKIFGTYASGGFRVSAGAEPVLSGSYSLRVNGLTQYAGLQQVVNVTPGGTYQALVPVYTSDGADLFRLVVRDINGGLIQTTASSVTGIVGGWDESTFALVDLVIPDGINQVIFRFAYVGTGNPSPFYVDDLQLTEGLAPTTIGQIMSDLYDDATSNHSSVRIMWDDDANPGTPWLSLDFTASVDSAGVAWVDSEISVKLWMRMTYLQVMEQFSRSYGYEWRIVPNSVSAGTYKLQIYNPGGMATDYSSSAAPAIQGGSSDVRRDVRRFIPRGTNFMVEGIGRITAREDSTGLESAIGRIEASRIDRELPSQASVADGAFQDAEDALSNANAYVYELVDPQDTPMVDYVVGDILLIHDPPDVDDVARLIDIEIVDTPQATAYETHFFPTTAAGS